MAEQPRRDSPGSAVDREAEVRAAMADFDFAPIQELLGSFHGLTGVQVAIVSRSSEVLVTTERARVCELFHGLSFDTLAACHESNRKVDAMLPELPPGGYADYRCANGLRDIAWPLLLEGVHWATLFLGQFLYEDDEVDEEWLEARALSHGWVVEDYMAAIREVPRFPRQKIAGLISSLGSFARIVTSLAYETYRERRLSLHDAATQVALGESDRRYRLLAENVGDVIWTIDPSTLRFTYVSPSIIALRGLSVEEAMAETLEDSMSPESFERVRSIMGELIEKMARGDPSVALARTGIFEQPCKDGSKKWIEVTTKPVFDGSGALVEITGVSRDATARVLADAELKKALADKDRLYAELQHRVKNSLALIVSLLSLEAGSIEDDAARLPLEEAQARVRSVGLLYEQLYRTRSVEDIDLGAYLPEVARAVVDSSASARGLRFESDCASVRIATDRAVSAGLLLYEMAANACKHAFPRGRGGAIRLGLGVEGNDVVLRLDDDGVGLPAGFDLEAAQGLGSLLIVQLAVQLGGSATAGPGLGDAGAGFVARFPLIAKTYANSVNSSRI
jgi:PAS domain S-box-containing protein